MQTFFVEIKCKLGKTYTVASALADREIASEIYSTAGDFDLLAKIYVESFDELADLVTDKIQKVRHIRETYRSESVVDPLRTLSTRDAALFQRLLDVLPNRHPREQAPAVLLKHHRHPGRRPRHGRALKHHAPCRGS